MGPKKKNEMGVADRIQKSQFVVDSNGEKQSVLIEFVPWDQVKVEPLSDDKFEALADQLADDFMDCVGPDCPPLSEYAVSRKGLYEGGE